MTLQRLGHPLVWVAALVLSLHCARGSESLSSAAQDLLRDEPAFLIREGTAWVQAERDRHRSSGVALSEDEKRRFAGYFSPQVLADARVRVVNTIDNPSFYSAYDELGKRVPLDFSGAVGLALIDTVLLRRSHGGPGTDARHSVLFHELVHLEQYRLFGAERYVEHYVRALADNGYHYRSHPFEAQAYELQNRYRQHPDRIFMVADEVHRRLGPGDPN